MMCLWENQKGQSGISTIYISWLFSYWIFNKVAPGLNEANCEKKTSGDGFRKKSQETDVENPESENH